MPGCFADIPEAPIPIFFPGSSHPNFLLQQEGCPGYCRYSICSSAPLPRHVQEGMASLLLSSIHSDLIASRWAYRQTQAVSVCSLRPMHRLQVLCGQEKSFILGKDVSTSLRTKAGPSTVTWVCLYPAWIAQGQDSSGPSKNVEPLSFRFRRSQYWLR